VLTKYKDLTSQPVLVNTSFNIHEEPIVCSPEDALRGFFEAALDYLYIHGVGIIPFKGNEAIAIQYLQERSRSPSNAYLEMKTINKFLSNDLRDALIGLKEKEAVIQDLIVALNIEREAHKLIQQKKQWLESFLKLSRNILRK
jgi:hypothetical protein